MDLTIYDIIKGPVRTEKAYDLNSKYQQLVLFVHPHANKVLVAQALRKLFGVEVESVRISIRKGKARKSGRRVTYGSSQKKAIVTLAEGHRLNLFDQAGTADKVTEHATVSEA
jgi:large subunit ribosomal protein L23